MSTNDGRVELYRSIADEVRVRRVEEIAARLRLSQDQVMKSLRESAAEDVIAFIPGTEQLRLAHPFCATDAPFEVSTGRRRWDAICI